MKKEYEDLDVDELVDLPKQAQAKLRYVAASGCCGTDQTLIILGTLIISRLIKDICNVLPRTYLVKETRTIEYETEVEANSKDEALNIYHVDMSSGRVETDNSDYEVSER